jgi:hypothetical protein
VLAAGALVAGANGLQLLRERIAALPPPPGATLYMTSGEAVRRMTIGYAALAADLYWIRAIQYFGDKRLAEATASDGAKARFYELLFPLLDLTTTLDPHFNIAYRFGSIFLAEPFPGGAGRPDQAVALLEKGLGAAPDKWEYVMDIGFVHYWWRHDYAEAAAWFGRASLLPNAPWWLRSLAATTSLQGGDRASSRRMWEEVRSSADNDWLRRSAERALMQLRALDEIDGLQRLVDRAREGGRLPLAGGVVQINGQVSVDPTGVPYDVDPAGRVRLGAASSLSPLPDQPAHQVVPVQ